MQSAIVVGITGMRAGTSTLGATAVAARGGLRAERDELVRYCDEAISAYLQIRGTAVYDHRRAALRYLSGSPRYEVLKRAGFRCELCGISADERAIEVDHIFPRSIAARTT